MQLWNTINLIINLNGDLHCSLCSLNKIFDDFQKSETTKKFQNIIESIREINYEILYGNQGNKYMLWKILEWRIMVILM